MSRDKNPAPRASILARLPALVNGGKNIASHSTAQAAFELAGDALQLAAHLIATNALAALGAARDADEAALVASFRAIAATLDAARDVYTLATGRTSP